MRAFIACCALVALVALVALAVPCAPVLAQCSSGYCSPAQVIYPSQIIYPGSQIIYPSPAPVVVPVPAVPAPEPVKPAGKLEKCSGDCCATGKPCGLPDCTCARKPAVEQKPDEGKGKGKPEPDLNFGIELGKIGLGPSPRYVLNGKEIPKASAKRLVESIFAPDIPDESRLLHLTLIGSKDDTARVLADLEQEPLKRLRDRFLVHVYDPANVVDAEIIKQRRFVSTGEPSIYLTAPDGAVVGRNLDGKYPGADELAKVIADASKPYHPDKDPDLKTPKPAPSAGMPDLSKVHPAVWVIGGLVLFLLLGKKQ